VIRQPVYLGMAMLMIAESVLFLMLILALVYFHDSQGRSDLRLPEAAGYTGCLLASSFTMFRAASDQESRSRPGLWMVATIVLGLIFLLGEGSECARLLRDGITMSGSLFGTAFFTLTGIYGVHVIVALLLVGNVVAIKPGDESVARTRTAVRAAAMYWYFISAIWIAIFSIVYLPVFV